MESAEAHVEYWERTLAAATSKDSNWEHRETFVDVDFDFDSQAGDTAEHDDPGDEESTSAGNSDMQLSMDTTPVTAAPTAVYPPTAASPFQHTMGSAFTSGGGSPALVSDSLVAAHAHMKYIKEQGAKHGIPEQMLEQAAIEGHSLELIISSYYQATMAGELLILKKQSTDLSHSPLAQRMADHLVKTYPDTKTTEPTGAKDEATLMHEFAASADC